MSAHENAGRSNEWYTPKYVFDAMAVRFDLDVAHPGLEIVSWVPADRIITADSLMQTWRGFLWMNPPFGARNGLEPWLEKFFAHGCGVALTPDRTSAPWWQNYARRSDLILFVAPKIHFVPGDGVVASSPGTGTTLMAAGQQGVQALSNAARSGLGHLFAPAGAAA